MRDRRLSRAGRSHSLVGAKFLMYLVSSCDVCVEPYRIAFWEQPLCPSYHSMPSIPRTFLAEQRRRRGRGRFSFPPPPPLAAGGRQETPAGAAADAPHRVAASDGGGERATRIEALGRPEAAGPLPTPGAPLWRPALGSTAPIIKFEVAGDSGMGPNQTTRAAQVLLHRVPFWVAIF